VAKEAADIIILVGGLLILFVHQIPDQILSEICCGSGAEQVQG
jgi:hypothetical protein